MTKRLTRREFLRHSAAFAAGTAGLVLCHAVPAQAQTAVPAEDLVDAGDGFRRGTRHGVVVAAASAGAVLWATGDHGMFTSSVLRSTLRFTHVGLHWSAVVPPKASLSCELRTSVDGSTWAPWQAASPARQPKDTPVGDYFAALVYAGAARYVQYRVAFQTAGVKSPSLHRVTATVIAAPAEATDTWLATALVQDLDFGHEIAVIPREQWGANERYRFDDEGQEVWPAMFVPVKKLVVHHTGTRNSHGSTAEAAADVRAIYYYHAVTQRWGDIGYNALIDRFGNIYEGRRGHVRSSAHAEHSHELLSADVVAGHARYHNYGSAGIGLLGDATRADWPMRSAAGPMWEALVRYTVFEAGRHALRPLKLGATAQTSTADAAASDFSGSNDVWTDDLPNVAGHRETYPTSCPGSTVMALLPRLREAIHTGLTDTLGTGVVVTSPEREVTLSEGLELSFAWQPQELPPGWTLIGYEYCFEGWHRPSESEDIEYLSGYTEGMQPYPAWTSVGPHVTSVLLRPTRAGHYTFHVRAVLQDEDTKAVRRSVYEGNHTYLVKPQEHRIWLPITAQP